MTAPEGIQTAVLDLWLEASVGLDPPLRYSTIAGGRSNLTYLVRDARDRVVVLRRPPLKQVLATAHDVVREHTIISALASTAVPVPEALALCTDQDVTGAPFYVMAFVSGHILRNQADAEAETDTVMRGRASLSLVDVLASIHLVDVDAVGLDQFGRRDSYVERQLARWRRQLEQATSDVPGELYRVHDALAQSVPPAGATGIVHGDFKVGNCVLGHDGNVRAVLDWELSTLGDPLADLAVYLIYWRRPSDGDVVEDIIGYPTLADGFLERERLVERYVEQSGRKVDDLVFYEAFAAWKLACILQGVLDRYRGGAMIDDGADVGSITHRIRRLAGEASALLD
jgi:aminoglycoside phosphotransferase (APT) family kinase protein